MSGGLMFTEDIERSDLDYFADTARSVEVVREENEQGRLGSFGFTLVQEKPPQVGVVVPGGPAEKAGLSKDDIVLAVNGQDVTRLTHQQVTDLIRNTKTKGVWLSVCEGDSTMNSRSNSLGRNNLSNMYSPSTPALNRQPTDLPIKRNPDSGRVHRNSLGSKRGPMYGTIDSLHTSPTKPLSMSGKGYMYATTNDLHTSQPKPIPGRSHMYGMNASHESLHTSPSKPHSNSASSFPRMNMMQQQGEAEYVALVPAPPIYTRISVLLNYVGPVKIPNSWSSRGVSSRCIQECARQLLSKRQVKDFLKVQLEVSQTSLRITNVQRNILVKHRRDELYYCGLCTNDEQYFAVVTKATASTPDSQQADLCHIFKLLPDSKLSTYCIDHKKSSREMKSGPEVPVKSCTNITNAIQSVFQSEEQYKASQRKIELTSSADSVVYGVVKGVSTFHMQSTDNGCDSNDSYSTYSSSPSSSSTSSPSLSRRKLDVLDLRPQGKASPPKRHQRSGSNPNFPSPGNNKTEFAPPSLAVHSSVAAGNGLHVRMGSDGSSSSNQSSSSASRNKTHTAVARKKSFQQDGAQRVSDSSLSSYSSDHSGQRSGSNSPSPVKTAVTGSLTKAAVSQFVSPVHRKSSAVDISPHRVRRVSQGRRPSYGLRSGAISPTGDASMLATRQLRRQNSETSILDLTANLSPYHHYGLPPKNSGHTASMDSIITVTTLAGEEEHEEADGENPMNFGRVAGWCASFDKLLEDPLGVQCLLEFLETEHSEENILFWREAQQYKTSSSANLQAAAKIIYDTYLSVSAPRQINIDDRVLKEVEASLANPTVNIFAEAQSQIYQLVKLDCHPRFVKSQLIKDCLCAEMEGSPLPIRMPDTDRATSKSPKPKKSKTMSHSNSLTRSIFTRLRGPQQSSSSIQPSEHRRSKKADKKEKDRGSKELGSKKQSKETVTAPSEQDNLNMLQAHRKNLCELSLPNRVTKIIEVPSSGTVRTAVSNVLKRYSYTLDIMEVKNASTLQPIDLDTAASVLVGKHISVIRSKNTVTVMSPDMPESILPANGSSTLRDMFDNFLASHNKHNSYSVYVEGARTPLELDLDTSILAGHTVTIKYLTAAVGSTVSTPPKKGSLSSPSGSSIGSNTSKSSKSSKSSKGSSQLSDGVEELFSMIARLNVDTLEDQRMPDRYSPDPPKESPPSGKKKSPRFSRTKSGSAIPGNKKKLELRRSLSPNPKMSRSQQELNQPPSPSSEPPTLSVPFNTGASLHPNTRGGNHRHQSSFDRLSGISTGSGSSVDSISHELAIVDQRQNTRHQLREWMANKSSQEAGGMPHYFPDAFGGNGTLDRGTGHQPLTATTSLPPQQHAVQHSIQDQGRSGSFTRGYHTMQHPHHRGPHPLDNIVNEAYITQKKGTWPPSQAAQQQMEYNAVSAGVFPGGNGGPVSSYPWRHVHGQQRALRPAEEFSDSGSVASSNFSGSNGPINQSRLSPTTHVLVVEDQTHETFV